MKLDAGFSQCVARMNNYYYCTFNISQLKKVSIIVFEVQFMELFILNGRDVIVILEVLRRIVAPALLNKLHYSTVKVVTKKLWQFPRRSFAYLFC